MQDEIKKQIDRALSRPEKIYFAIGSMFLALAWVEWIKESVPTGRWAWVHIIATEIFGSKGHPKLLLAISVIWFVICLSCWFVRIGRSNKESA